MKIECKYAVVIANPQKGRSSPDILRKTGLLCHFVPRNDGECEDTNL